MAEARFPPGAGPGKVRFEALCEIALCVRSGWACDGLLLNKKSGQRMLGKRRRWPEAAGLLQITVSHFPLSALFSPT